MSENKPKRRNVKPDEFTEAVSSASKIAVATKLSEQPKDKQDWKEKFKEMLCSEVSFEHYGEIQLIVRKVEYFISPLQQSNEALKADLELTLKQSDNWIGALQKENDRLKEYYDESSTQQLLHDIDYLKIKAEGLQKENERLNGLLEKEYKGMLGEYCSHDEIEESWQKFKLKNNISVSSKMEHTQQNNLP